MILVRSSILLFLALFSQDLVGHSNGEVEETILSVIVIYRHGDRAPITPYPNDPYKDPSLWPMGFGQLSKIGKEQQYELGQWLRDRYKNFLHEEFSPKEIYVRSTDVDRTLMSAECNLAGLYPPDANQTWNPSLHWQPIPVHTVPELLDPVLAMKKPCGKFEQMYRALFRTQEFIDMQERNRELYKYMSENTGANINGLDSVLSIYTTLYIEELYNHTLPEWTKSVYPQPMYHWASFAFALPTYTPQLALLRTGPLMNEIYKSFAKDTSDSVPKMYMYSAHDTTIADVLNTLGLFDLHCPPYTSTIIFELRARGINKFVNVLYKNSTTPQKMVLKGCSKFDCPVDEFNLVFDTIRLPVDEWEATCEPRFLGLVAFNTLQTSVFVGCMTLLAVLLVSFIVSIIWSRQRRNTVNYLRIPNREE